MAYYRMSFLMSSLHVYKSNNLASTTFAHIILFHFNYLNKVIIGQIYASTTLSGINIVPVYFSVVSTI